MTLERHYFLSNDLDDLEHVETELLAAGVTAPQIHVLSRDNAGVHHHPQLSGVPSFMKRDLVHSGLVGATIGGTLALLVLAASSLAGWTSGPAGWTPFVFLAMALFGASAWLGGLWGIQNPNHHFRRFQSTLDGGKHVFFVDLDEASRKVLEEICAAHPGLESAGTGAASPPWALAFSNRTSSWWYWRLWKNA